jgi:hypothetical protein
MPAVAELKQMVFFAPVYSEISRSNRLVLGPVVIHPESRVSATSSTIFWSMRGGEKGIIGVGILTKLMTAMKVAHNKGFSKILSNALRYSTQIESKA